jgi:hypothetical protein
MTSLSRNDGFAQVEGFNVEITPLALALQKCAPFFT